MIPITTRTTNKDMFRVSERSNTDNRWMISGTENRSRIDAHLHFYPIEGPSFPAAATTTTPAFVISLMVSLIAGSFISRPPNGNTAIEQDSVTARRRPWQTEEVAISNL